MLKKLEGLRDVFAPKDVHPLADPRELRRVLEELPMDNAFKALDEVVGWFESLQGETMAGEVLYEATRQLDEAAQIHLKRVTRIYLTTPRLSRADEKRLWTISHGFCLLLSNAYERCLVAALQKTRTGELLKPALPLICARLIAALGDRMKWLQFRYGPSPTNVWQRLGQVLMLAETHGVAQKNLQLYPNQPGMSCAQLEFVKMVAFQAASMDSLLPVEIEIAERLIAHFVSAFVFSAKVAEDSVYWLDLQLAPPPLRLVKMPKAAPTLRFFKPATGHAQIEALLHALEAGGEVPAGINLGAPYTARQLLPVLRHLAAYLAPIPPQRSQDRHRVKHRMSVLHGLNNAFVVLAANFGGSPVVLPMESWVVENVSRGGFGALLNNLAAEWLRVGALIAMQPEGGNNWLLGIVRRYHRESETETRIGIQTLAQHAVAVDLTPLTASREAAGAVLTGLLIQQAGVADEVLLVLPPASFDLRESLTLDWAGRRQVLSPLGLTELTEDYEVARYRLRAAA